MSRSKAGADYIRQGITRGSYDTRDTPAYDQLAEWERFNTELHARMRFDHSGARSHAARTTFLRADTMQLVRFRSERTALRRTARDVAVDYKDHCEFLSVLSGEVTIAHERRE